MSRIACPDCGGTLYHDTAEIGIAWVRPFMRHDAAPDIRFRPARVLACSACEFIEEVPAEPGKGIR